MSLIPSESYSFPDHFTGTVIPPRKPKHEKVSPDKIQEQPTIVALPDPKPGPAVAISPVEPEVISERSETAVPKVSRPVLNPALRRVQAPPPRIPDAPTRRTALPPTLKPGVRWNDRAPAMDPSQSHNNGNGHRPNEFAPAPAPLPAQNVIPMQAPRIARPPQSALPSMLKASQPPMKVPAPAAVTKAPSVSVPVRKPVPAAPAVRPFRPQPATPVAANPQADFFEMFTDEDDAVANQRRRQMKFRRFVACEIGAVAVLLPLLTLGLTSNITAPSLRWILDIFTITAAVSAAIIPIVFYAGTPTLPQLER